MFTAPVFRLTKETMMDANLLAGIAGVLLSLGFSYIPGLDVWFAGLPDTNKKLIMGGLIILTGAVAFGLSCADWFATITCNKEGATGLITAIGIALIANQGVFKLSPVTNRKLKAKLDGEILRAEGGDNYAGDIG
jgi:hypothetical protein